MYRADIILDSVATDPWGRTVRLTTMEVVFPRFILAEFNTHRAFARNSASSRAIPAEKMMARIRQSPFVPSAFGMNKRGMQAGEELDDRDNSKAADAWRRGLAAALETTDALVDIGVHKQWTNRPLEPYMWHTVIVTATEFDNFFNRRNHPAAQPEMQIIAAMMEDAYNRSVPVARKEHFPYVQPDEETLIREARLKLSTGRCARVSYLTHDGRRDLDADYRMHDDLLTAGHMSPFEHQAWVVEGYRGHKGVLYNEDEQTAFAGNLRLPWYQHRKSVPNEWNVPRAQ